MRESTWSTSSPSFCAKFSIYPKFMSLHIPPKNKPGQTWSTRRIFSIGAIVSAIKGIFLNIEDILAVFLTVLIGLAEIFGGTVSWRLYVLTLVVYGIRVAQKYVSIPDKDNRLKEP